MGDILSRRKAKGPQRKLDAATPLCCIYRDTDAGAWYACPIDMMIKREDNPDPRLIDTGRDILGLLSGRTVNEVITIIGNVGANVIMGIGGAGVNKARNDRHCMCPHGAYDDQSRRADRGT